MSLPVGISCQKKKSVRKYFMLTSDIHSFSKHQLTLSHEGGPRLKDFIRMMSGRGSTQTKYYSCRANTTLHEHKTVHHPP